MSTLYIVATPIGNLQDITLRALETLKKVDIIACEDTRHTMKLLNHFSIQKRVISCRARNEANSAQGIIKLLDEGNEIAYVSDAGTPGLSDPGNLLVREVRKAGFSVIPLPGASAFATLLSVGGFSGKTINFDGFLSPKGGKRKNRVKELAEREEAFLLYESPFRIVKLLADLAELLPERQIVVGREMTKIHEEYLFGTVQDVFYELQSRKSIKGEFAVLVSGKKNS